MLGELRCKGIEFRRSSQQSTKSLETVALSKAMKRNQKEDQKREWRVIMKILESQEGDFGISYRLCPVGTQSSMIIQYNALLL